MGIYVFRNNQVEGPFDELVLLQALRSGMMSPDEQCCREGANEWAPASALISPAVPPAPLKHIPDRPKPKLSSVPTRKLSNAQIGMMIGGSIIALLLLLALVGILSSPDSGDASGRTQTSSVRVEQILSAQLQKKLDVEKQQVFDAIHPSGTANRIVLHDVTVTAWKNGRDTNRMADIQQFTFRYTVYWTGLMTKDGYTKVSQVYDLESQVPGATEVIATNGVTKKDLATWGGNALGVWLQYEAQKAGAEQASKDYYQR